MNLTPGQWAAMLKTEKAYAKDIDAHARAVRRLPKEYRNAKVFDHRPAVGRTIWVAFLYFLPPIWYCRTRRKWLRVEFIRAPKMESAPIPTLTR